MPSCIRDFYLLRNDTNSTVRTFRCAAMLTVPVSAQQWLLLAGILAAIPVLLGIRRRREGIRYWVRRIVLLESVYLGIAYIMLRKGQPPLESILAGMVAAFFIDSFIKPRSRHIPASVKRNLRAKHELRTGRKFNPQKYEYDHKVAFSRGGSHTTDNLKIVEKKRNRSKGSKTVWWDILGR